MIVNITKEYILDNVKEEDIISRYLNINVYDIIDSYTYNTLIKSPFRVDSKPSLGFKYIGNRLKYNDFGAGNKGDCFDIVSKVLCLNSNNSRDFVMILQHIANTFNLDNKDSTFFNSGIINNKVVKITKVITITIRDWYKQDFDYFNKYGIFEILHVFNVVPISEYTYDDNTYNVGEFNPGYAISCGKLNDVNIIKIYIPKSKDFYTNGNILHYHKLYAASEVLIITKSFKDAAVIIDITKGKILDVTINVLYVPNENYIIDSLEMIKIKCTHDIIVTLFDYDNAGIHLSWLYRKLYNTIPMFITDKLWNRKKLYRYSKDISDYRKHNGKLETINLITNKMKEMYELIELNRKLKHENNYRK